MELNSVFNDTKYQLNNQSPGHDPVKKSPAFAPAVDTDELKSRFDLRDVFEQHYGKPARHSAKYSVWPSPWRDDGKHASLTVYADHYIDYGGTGETGDLFDFLAHEYGHTFPQAIQWALQHSAGGYSPAQPRQERQERPTAAAGGAEWQTAGAGHIERCQQALWGNEPVLNYLRWERGLSDETIKACRLGWNAAYQRQNGLRAGIVIPGFQDGSLWFVKVRTITGAFADYLGVPSATYKGRPVDKYVNMTGSKVSGTLYNGDEISPGCILVFVEGEFDCILAQQELGDGYTVVSLGSATNRLSPVWKERVLEAAEIYIALDNDGAGNAATQHLLTELDERATVLKYPDDCKDMTDYFNRGGNVRAWLTSQTNPRIFPDGMPVMWSSIIMKFMRPGAALLYFILQAAARAGAIDPECFTFVQVYQWMCENGYTLAQSTLYRWFQQCDGELFSKSDTLSYSGNSFKDNVSENENKSRGKPSDAYSLRTITDFERTIRKQVWARLYDGVFKTDGTSGIKARPRIQQLTRLGVSDDCAASIAPALDKAYQPIYRRQRWAVTYAERRIKSRYAEIIAELADRTPIKCPVNSLSDLEDCVLAYRLKENEPISQKKIAGWIGRTRSYVGKVITRAGYQGYQPDVKIIPVKPGENIKRAAHDACPDGCWIGLKIDDNPTPERFEQSIANRASRSVAMVIQPPNAYKYVGIPDEIPPVPAPPKSEPERIDLEPAPAPPYKPAPYFGDDVSPEVDHNQLVLGLTLGGWEYEVHSGFWYHHESDSKCRTMIEAVKIQAGISPAEGSNDDEKHH